MASKLKKPDQPKPAAKPSAVLRTTRPSSPGAQRTVRETVESIAVAFVLAFLFRTFEAEAFVIPTGSMAPTLQGRHKDLICPECKFRYRVSASSEEDEGVQAARAVLNNRNSSVRQRDDALRAIADKDVVAGTCPNCRFMMDVDQTTEKGSEWPSYNGDRILVAKFPYDFADPDRWDVVVFRFPGNSAMNYIKRMIGRPHETVRIRHGDIYIRPGDEAAASSSGADAEGFDIARKPPEKVWAMSQTVYDNDYIVDDMTAAGWPLRWQPWHAGDAAETWKSPDGGRSYAIGAAEGDSAKGDSPQREDWIRYQHFIPFGDDWADIKEGHAVHAPRPRLISDFYAYNSGEVRRGSLDSPMNWVGDLVLETAINAQSAQGTILLDLVRAGRHGRCEIDLESGEALLKMDGSPDFQPRAKTKVRGAGRHRVTFANVDRQLLLWVDGKTVTFDADTAYPAVGDDIPTQDDLAPAGIGSRGAALAVEHILLRRDVYYIATHEAFNGISDYAAGMIPRDLIDYFAEPEKWTGDSLFAHRREVTFPLAADQFFVLGDNSPASKDSRLWSQDTRNWSMSTRSWSGDHPEFYVSRELLIGKALFIYWPHSFDRLPIRLPLMDRPLPFPYFPNFKDMGFVR